LLIGEAGAGGVMVIFVAAVGCCYSCDTIAASTRVLGFKNERIIEEIAFIFGTGVTGSKCNKKVTLV